MICLALTGNANGSSLYPMNTTATGLAHCPTCHATRRIIAPIIRYWGGRSYLRRVNWPRVECCGRLLLVEEIKGRVTNQPCDARCMGAHGPNCDCSCGGKNHGLAYA